MEPEGAIAKASLDARHEAVATERKMENVLALS